MGNFATGMAVGSALAKRRGPARSAVPTRPLHYVTKGWPFWTVPLLAGCIYGHWMPNWGWSFALIANIWAFILCVLLARFTPTGTKIHDDVPSHSPMKTVLGMLGLSIVSIFCLSAIVGGWFIACGLVGILYSAKRAIQYQMVFGSIYKNRADILARFGPQWSITAVQLGLTNSVDDPGIPDAQAERTPDGEGIQVTLTPRAGKPISDLATKSEHLRTLVGAHWASVKMVGNSVVYELRDSEPPSPLNLPVEWSPEFASYDMSRCPIGIDEDGQQICVAVEGGHTVLVGVTGAGKASVMWSLIGSVASRPDALVWGIDFKGGKEMRTNPDVFCEPVASTPDSLMEILEMVYAEMLHRNQTMGRDFASTPEVPLYFLVIDEAASLYMAMKNAPKAQFNRFERIMTDILNMGRSANISVFAALQEPVKSAWPFRDMFPQRIALRMPDMKDQILYLGGASIKAGHTWEYPQFPKSARGRGLMHVASEKFTGYKEFKAYYPTTADIEAMSIGVNPAYTNRTEPETASFLQQVEAGEHQSPEDEDSAE